MIALALILLLAGAGSLTAAAVTLWPTGTYCVVLALAGAVVLAMAVQLAQEGVPGLAALMAAGGVAAQVAGVAAGMAETADRAARAAHPAW